MAELGPVAPRPATVDAFEALEQALACWRSPRLARTAGTRPLPPDLRMVVRLASGDELLADDCAAVCGVPAATLTEAAAFYVQHVQFATGADSYRVLGVNPDADEARIKEHYRWLVRWLHPDRNDDLESAYADRVNCAWQDLRTPERRAAYDAALAQGTSRGDDTAGPDTRRRPALRVSRWNEPDNVVSARTAQRLPLLVLGTFGFLAGAALTAMWYEHSQEADESAGARRAAVAAAAVPKPVFDPPSLEVALPAVALPAPVLPLSPSTGATTAGAGFLAAPSSGATTPIGAGPSTPTTTAPVDRPAAHRDDPLPPAMPLPGEEAGREVVRRFETAYAAGDLQRLMALFTADARNGSGGRDRIARDYRTLFDGSHSRELVVQPVGWVQRDEGATLLGRYTAAVRKRGRLRTETSEGAIRFELRLDGGTLKIHRMEHVVD